MNKSELRDCTMDDHFTTNAPALWFRITDFSRTFADQQTQLLELINVDLFLQTKWDWWGLMSAYCLDLDFAWNLHGFWLAIIPFVLFYDWWNISLGAGQFGGIPSKTVGRIQAKAFTLNNYSLLQFFKFCWVTCMLRFQAICRFSASWIMIHDARNHHCASRLASAYCNTLVKALAKSQLDETLLSFTIY